MSSFEFPPMLARVQVGSGMGFWFPLFLVWPFVLAFLILLSPFLLIAYVVLWATHLHQGVGTFFIAFYKVICAVKGLEVDVTGPHAGVRVLIK